MAERLGTGQCLSLGAAEHAEGLRMEVLHQGQLSRTQYKLITSRMLLHMIATDKQPWDYTKKLIQE